MRHILSARQFDTEGLAAVFKRADMMRKYDGAIITPRKGVVATLFYEPSTRTRLSFESAAQRLGLGVISTENAAEFSSASKGETIEDTIRVVGGYADIIVLRHPETGTADRAAAVSTVPIINAGDGKGEHPTQALLDAYTIQHEKGRLDNLHVVLGGDLANGRTARSLVRLLALYPGNKLTFVSTPELRMGEDIRTFLREQGVSFSETDYLHDALRQADVVYWTRLQKERLNDPSLVSGFTIDQDALRVMKPDAILMHPLPRVGEIDPAIDADPRAAYFRQAHNGLYVRMALLSWLLH